MLTQRIRLHGASADQTALETASTAILDGNLIALPTETFYALSADVYNLRAVERIFQIKGRPDWKALLVLIDSVDQAEVISDNIPPVFYEIAARYWPGPLTLILPAAKRVPLKVTGGTGTVGMRIPNQPFTLSVIDKVRLPIIGTSANLSGHPSCSHGGGRVEPAWGQDRAGGGRRRLSGNCRFDRSRPDLETGPSGSGRGHPQRSSGGIPLPIES